MKDMNTYKQLDDALLSFSVLRRLGTGKMNTFENRLRTQKAHYFAQLFGIVLNYPYNLYLNGPYSPELASDFYYITNNRLKPDLDRFVSDDLEKEFVSLKGFVLNKSNRQLEILATFHWFLNCLKMNIKDAKQKLIDMKDVNKRELNYVLSNIKELPK